MKRFIIHILLLFASQQLFCQSFYVTTSNNSIKRITINGTNIIEEDMNFCAGIGSNIAFYKGALYYSTSGGLLGMATLSGNSFINCTNVCSMTIGNSLTVDANGIFYSVAGNNLYKADPSIQSTTKVGTLPFNSAGDLIFYKNNLYLAAIGGIVKVNITDPSQSQLVIPDAGVIYGLASVAFSSTQNKVYALRITTGGTDLIELDLDNYTYVQTIATLPYGVFDAASDVEDGSTLKLNITAVNQYVDCTSPDKTTVQVVCEGANSFYQYTLNNITNNTGVFVVDPGDYTLTVKSLIDQLSQQLTVQALVIDKPVLSVSKTDYTCTNTGQITISTANSGAQYLIKYGGSSFNFNHTFSDLLPGDYHFDILNSNSCVVETTDVTIINNADCKTINFPNTFTPNNDGVNDVFRPVENGSAANATLSVYNRYGTFIFATDNFINGWNGNYKGKPVPAGTYYWIARYTDGLKQPITKKGYVTLIR